MPCLRNLPSLSPFALPPFSFLFSAVGHGHRGRQDHPKLRMSMGQQYETGNECRMVSELECRNERKGSRVVLRRNDFRAARMIFERLGLTNHEPTREPQFNFIIFI